MSSREVALNWYERVAVAAYGHYRAALLYSRLNFWLGIPTVVFATIVGTSVFASLQIKPDVWWQVTVGVMSIVAAILSALQSFLGFNDKAEKHRTAGSRFNAVGRELEFWLSLAQEDLVKLDGLRSRIDALAEESPHIPQTVHKYMPEKASGLIWKP